MRRRAPFAKGSLPTGSGAIAIAIAASVAFACGGDRGRHAAEPSAAPVVAGLRDAGRVGSSGRSTRTPDTLPLVPRPRSLTRCEGALTIDRATRIAIDDARALADAPEARAIGERLARWLGLPPAAVDASTGAVAEPMRGIVLRLERSAGDSARPARDAAIDPPRDVGDEAYTLDVSPERAIVRARRPAGLFYGAQTIAELAGARRIGQTAAPLDAEAASWSVPCVVIDDAPRFAFRAMHLDVARHFFTPDVVARWIDLLAFYRFNVFHWHLTDDQGFRLEVRGHPELTATGGADGFYTRDDARKIVSQARERFITVMPEIEMPGHARAILAAHPELSCTGKRQSVPRTWGVFEDVLCAGNERTYALVEDVLGEVAAIFPSHLVHIGGDEVPPARWSACAKCRAALARAKPGRFDASALQGLFMKRAASILARLGRRAAVWDEALSDALPGDAVVLAWQSKDRGRDAAERGFDVVMAPHDHVYLNIRQSHVKGEPGHEGLLPWTKVRGFDPVPEGLEAARSSKVLGGEGTLWTEYVETPEQIDAMAMPRVAALAEALWTGTPSANESPAGRDAVEADFAARLGAQLPALDASGVRYFVEPPRSGGDERLRERMVFVEGDAKTVMLAAPRLFPSGVVRFTTDGSEPSRSSPMFRAPLEVRDTTTITAALFLPSGRASAPVRAMIVREALRPPMTLHAPIAGASFVYVEGDFHRLPDFTRTAASARGHVASIGLAGVESALGRRMRKERFALVFDGFVDATVDGVHRVVAHADDGVRVEIDGERILEDDGEHEARDSEGEIALRKGYHRIRVTYFQGSEGKALDLAIAAPGGPLAPLAVVRDGSAPPPP
ncbi:MAG: family 20 glycosylhydrolase [Labilithrix sp.]|nr:family 20 glycosylhydrolase [Labilithrix sp.]